MPSLDTLPKTRAALEEGIDRGLHLGAQVYVSVGGETVADGALGEDEPGVPLAPDALMLWLSSTKPLTAAAVLQLWERGLFALDDPVARHLPEFAAGGKGEVTVRHLLTHTSGVRMLQVGFPEDPWEKIQERIASRRLEPRWVPGEKAGYHMSSSWFVLGELVQRLDGRSFPAYMREEVFEPLGMDDCWIGMPAERYRAYVEAGRIARMWNTAGGRRIPLRWHSEAWVTRPSPGGNGRGPVSQLARFYEALLAGGGILSPQAVEAMAARHRVGLVDHTFKHHLDWGLGVIVDSKHYGEGTAPYGYGPHASQRAFGHSGYRSSVGFADPAHRLVVALAVNGTPDEDTHESRTRRVLGALYEDLGIARG